MAQTTHFLCLLALDNGRLDEAETLANTLQLPLIREGPLQGFSHALALTSTRLELRMLGHKAPGPISAELNDSDIRRRLRGGRRQPLARACGLHRGGARHVLDATAGLGRDGRVLAGLGCPVTLIERSAIVAALLRDGLSRIRGLGQPIELLQMDATDYMQRGETRHDVVYLDPMYPHGRKQALPRKEMRVLRAIVGDDPDASRLFDAALAYADRRVVVKRPPRAGCMGDRKPDYQLRGNLARYDVYLTG